MKKKFLIILFCCTFFQQPLLANNLKVYFAGFSFLGDKKGEFGGMPLTSQLQREKVNNQDVITYIISENLKKTQPKNFNIDFSMAELEKGQSIIMSVGIVKENNSEEYNSFSKSYNNNIEVFLQILFYDFKEKKLIAAIPIFGEVNFITEAKATNAEKLKEYRHTAYLNRKAKLQEQKNKEKNEK